MRDPELIVIVSHPLDPHAEAVQELLRRDGEPTLLLDLTELPERATLSVGYRADGLERLQLMRQAGGAFDLGAVRAVWWRRPQAPSLGSLTDHRVVEFTHNEWQEALNGLWQLIDARWMNPPASDTVAGRKVLQLRVAAELGLRIPRTLVTSDPALARAFIEAEGVGRTVFKTFSCTHDIWRETRLVGPDDLALLDRVRLAPVIFQEYIPGAADLRVTAVGDTLFAAAIHASETDYPVDFRMSLGQARTERYQLPEQTAGRILALMRRLGLAYGAIDLRLTPEGEIVFLEVNTAGEFLFVEQRTGLPITRAVADWLRGPARSS